jgi:hypothetical protein
LAVDRMTTAEAEHYCGSGKGYFKVSRWAGKGPVYYRQQTRIYYLKSDLDVWKRQRRAAVRVVPAKRRSLAGNSPASVRSTAEAECS